MSGHLPPQPLVAVAFLASQAIVVLTLALALGTHLPGITSNRFMYLAQSSCSALRQALTTLAHEILSLMRQPDYLPLMRILIAETARFPELGPLFFAAIPRQGLGIIMGLLRAARGHGVIAKADDEVVARALLGGLLTYAIEGLLAEGGETFTPPDRADTLVEVMLRAVKL